jgi:hypothetical protein
VVEKKIEKDCVKEEKDNFLGKIKEVLKGVGT